MDAPAGALADQQCDLSPSGSMHYFHHPSDPYRDHALTTPSHPPLLPPIQHFDGQTMQSQPQPQYPMNAHIAPPPPAHHHHHPPPYQPAQYHYPNGLPAPPMPSNVGVNGQNGGGMMRYTSLPLPPQAGMQLPNARPKKDIKRRTKTGCLTCRKRRIKCDEGHPTCRNCQKSKRECLGYDPIFKQQPGPALIQPAPSANSSLKSDTSPQPSPAYQQPTAYPAGAYRGHPQGVDGQVEYGAPLDPALGSRSPSLTMAANSFSTILQPERQVKFIDMDQLFCLNDVRPRYQARSAPPPDSTIPEHQVEEFYRFHYAAGLDRLFETSWYSERGMHYIHNDPSLLDFTMQVMDQMKSRTDDIASVQNLISLEARLVWLLAAMPRSHPPSNGSDAFVPDDSTHELTLRIDTVENLLTGQFLPPNHVTRPPTTSPPSSQDNRTHIQQSFWHHLSRLASLRDDTPAHNRDIADCLATMRSILSMLETRDVLYSLAIVRHIGGRLLEFDPPRPVHPQTDDPNDEVKKLQVAQMFVAAEEGKGTTQVIQRVCGMAMRGWVLGRHRA